MNGFCSTILVGCSESLLGRHSLLEAVPEAAAEGGRAEHSSPAGHAHLNMAAREAGPG